MTKDIVARLRKERDHMVYNIGMESAESRLLAEAADENERLRSWMYEAINSLSDPQDACDHNDNEVAALRATIEEAIGKLRTGLRDKN